MQNHTDTLDLRRDFADKFLASPQDHDDVVLNGSMETLLVEFDCELVGASKRWTHLDLAAERTEVDRWLSDRGYIETEYLEW